jgi:hypothetical protein
MLFPSFRSKITLVPYSLNNYMGIRRLAVARKQHLSNSILSNWTTRQFRYNAPPLQRMAPPPSTTQSQNSLRDCRKDHDPCRATCATEKEKPYVPAFGHPKAGLENSTGRREVNPNPATGNGTDSLTSPINSTHNISPRVVANSIPTRHLDNTNSRGAPTFNKA